MPALVLRAPLYVHEESPLSGSHDRSSYVGLSPFPVSRQQAHSPRRLNLHPELPRANHRAHPRMHGCSQQLLAASRAVSPECPPQPAAQPRLRDGAVQIYAHEYRRDTDRETRRGQRWHLQWQILEGSQHSGHIWGEVEKRTSF